MIETMTIILTFMLYSYFGAMTRTFFGIYKVYTSMIFYKLDKKRVAIEIIASIFFGTFFTLLLQEMGVLKLPLNILAMIGGFFGADLVDIISKKVGLTKGIHVNVAEEQVALSEFNDRQIIALEYLRDHKRITSLIYQRMNETTRNVARYELRHLVTKGKLKMFGGRKSTYYKLS